jgi:hypothetical protein
MDTTRQARCASCDELRRQLETPTEHYQDLHAGDEVTVQLRAGDQIVVQWTDQATIPGVVQSTCEFGALVSCPKPNSTATFDLYVRHRNQHGHWYR